MAHRCPSRAPERRPRLAALLRSALLLLLAPLLLLAVAASCAGARGKREVGRLELPPGTVQHAVRFDSTPWWPCPPTMPPGCELFVLEGDPQAEDLYGVRLRLAEGFHLPPHSHPKDERVTVLAGRVAVAFGKEAKRETAQVFGPGDYYVNARGAVHSVWVEAPAVLQLVSVGPWKTVPAE